MEVLPLSILICFDLFGIATSLCELKSVSIGFASSTRGRGSNPNAVIKQCLGTCYNSVCEPLRTRIIKVESGNQFESDGGMFAVQRERGKRRRKSFPRQRSAHALRRISDSPGSASPSSHYHQMKIPLTLEVVDHLDCHCALQVLNQVKVLASSQKGSQGSVEPSQFEARPEDPSSSPTIHPIYTSTAFPPSSGSSPSLSSLANGSSESYQTCLACKKQAEICEVHGQVYDPNVCHCVYPASRTFLNSFYTLGK